MTYQQAIEVMGSAEYFDGGIDDRLDGGALWTLDYWRRTLPVPFKRNKRRYR